MFGTTRMHIRLVLQLAVVAAAAAFLVPAASATGLITDTLAPGGTSASGSHFITDTLAPGGSSVPATGYRLITDTLAPGGGAGGVISFPSVGGFSWADAGVGALLACALMLLALTAYQLVGRRRRGQLVY